MKIKIIKLFLILAIAPAIMQGQYANIWRMGYFCGLNFNSGAAQPFLFNQTIYINETNTGICNSNGNLLFFTNGAAVFNASNDTMLNGDNLYHTAFATPYAQYGMVIAQGDIIIPKPGSATDYYLFHETTDWVGSLNAKGILYYSIIDMSMAGGLGAVTSTKNVFLADTLMYGKLTAVKHGNGRDWWLMSKKIGSKKYCKWLITPSGINGPYYQLTGTISSNEVGADEAVFSPDGNYYAQSMYDGSPSHKNLDLFGFNRCSGNLDSLCSIHLNDSSTYLTGCSFSSNNRYLYVSTEFFLYQFDLLASNIPQSKIQIAVTNGVSAPFMNSFNCHQIGPDGKIYICCGDGNWVIHVINEPDSAGLDCNFVQQQINYNTNLSNIRELPNLPNYNLGSLVGSLCDTLTGINSLDNSILDQIDVSPNPNTGNFTVSYYGTTEAKQLMVYNTLGKKVYSQPLPRWSSIQNIVIKNLSPGIYYCKIENTVGESVVTKFIVIWQ